MVYVPVIFKSHYLRASDSLNYGLEIEKIDFREILSIFNFCQEMNKIAYFFIFSLPFPWQPRFSIFSIFQQYFELKNYNILDCPPQEAMWQMFVFVLSNN